MNLSLRLILVQDTKREEHSMTFLIGKNMTGGYGGSNILNSCTIGAEKGEITVVVGPNGAGKSLQ